MCRSKSFGPERPGLLFDHASGWLIGHKVLLPCVSILERFASEIRSRMESRLWRLLVHDVSDNQRQRLDELLVPVEGSRQPWFDQLRKGPVRVSGPALQPTEIMTDTGAYTDVVFGLFLLLVSKAG
jgi:hypothetical protein